MQQPGPPRGTVAFADHAILLLTMVSLFSLPCAGQQATELALQNSVSAVVARIRARSCCTPMPFASQVPVQNSESGRGNCAQSRHVAQHVQTS